MNSNHTAASTLKTMTAWDISPLRLSSQMLFGDVIHRNLFRDLPKMPIHRQYQLAIIVRHIEEQKLEGALCSLRDACILSWIAPELIPPILHHPRLLLDWCPDPDDTISISTDLEILLGSEQIKRALGKYQQSNICRWVRSGQSPSERSETAKEVTAALL